MIIPIAFLCVNSAALRFSMDKAERKSDVFTVGVRVTLVGFFAFLLFAFGCLTYAFMTDNFSVAYVASNSNSASSLKLPRVMVFRPFPAA